MEITNQKKDGITNVGISGRLDAASANEVEEKLNELIDGNDKLLIDLEKLEYISSAGLRVLLVVAKKVRKNNGKMCLCSLSENVSEVFQISGFSAIFDIAEFENDALKILNN